MKFYLTPTPEFGDKRRRNKFAYIPTKVGNVIVWLESYTVYEEYGPLSGWQETKRVVYGL
jgi:hypothetical protein